MAPVCPLPPDGPGRPVDPGLPVGPDGPAGPRGPAGPWRPSEPWGPGGPGMGIDMDVLMVSSEPIRSCILIKCRYICSLFSIWRFIYTCAI